MALTFAQQQSKLSRLLGDSNTSTDDQWPLADRKSEINRGELIFAQKSRSLIRQINGTVSSQKISLPSGYLGIHVLFLSGQYLTGEAEMPLADAGRYLNSGDYKYYFWVDGTASTTRAINFIDSNANSEAYRLYYFGLPTTDLSGDSDESPLQDEYREGPVFYAASQLLPQTGKLELAEYYNQKFLQIVNEAKEETEKHVMSVIKAVPDVYPAEQLDRDVQGVGQQW